AAKEHHDHRPACTNARREVMARAVLLAVAFAAIPADARPPLVLKVGKGKQFARPSQAAAAAKEGAIVEIDAGIYEKDVAGWSANNPALRGMGGRAHLKSGGEAADRKAIWVLQGSNVTVENIEFSGCEVSDGNGAGIRHEGDKLTVRNCFFHDNE